MSNEEAPSPRPDPAPSASNGGENVGNPAPSGGGERRQSRFRDGTRPEKSGRSADGGDYKPSESSARRESSGRRPERDRERGPSSGSERPRSGGGGRDGGRRPDSDGRHSGGGSGGRPERRGPGGKRRSDDDAPQKEPVAEQPAKETAQPVSFLEELGGDLLDSVSRSFGLTIKVLPASMREPITVGYLLARSLDTVADTAAVPVEKRLEHLRALLEMIKAGVDPEQLTALQKELAAKQTHEGERELIKKLGRCLAWLESISPEDRWDLVRALSRIGRGQELDLLRFGAGNEAQPKALANEVELAEYTYFVAGCVGELWTKLSARHLPADWSKLGFDEMLKLGKHFGQGLQMVNILRDLPDDLADGRCYLPETLLSARGLTAETLASEPAKAKAILDQLREQTVAKLDDAWKYAHSLTPMKLRYACTLPVLLGFETLGLIAKTSPLESDEPLKFPKSGMRGLMLSTAVGAAVGPWRERQYRSARAKAIGKR